MIQQRPHAERGDAVADLVGGDHAAGHRGRRSATNSSSPKLIVSGSSAEHPSPASPKATTPSAGSPSDSEAMIEERGGQDEGQQRGR